MNEFWQLFIVAVCFAIMRLDISMRERRELERHKREEDARIKRYFDIMADPEWKAAMRRCRELSKRGAA